MQQTLTCSKLSVKSFFYYCSGYILAADFEQVGPRFEFLMMFNTLP